MMTIRIIFSALALLSLGNFYSSANLDNSFFTLSLNAVKPQKSHANCSRQVKRCVPLNTSLCMDVSLPYKYTSNSLPFESSLDDYLQIISITHEYLERWKGLRSIPQCWKALQTTLCATFFPRCDNESSRVILPTNEMCHLTRGSCRIIDQHFRWPEFLNCENETLFATKCLNLYQDLKFSNTIVGSRCAAPLVSTDDRKIWYPGFDGCALHCINPIYTEEQHNQMLKIVAYGAVLSLLFTSFAVCTFLINRACLKRRFYTLIVFYMNLCMLLSTLGWSLQFFKGRHEIVCRADNTTRYEEPSKSDHFYCCLSFFLIYYFSFAALIWFVHLFKVFYKTFYGLSTGVKMDFNKFHFHMSAWSIPLILIISILLLGEIDGDSLRGICFVGSFKPMVRIIFVLVPLTIGVLIGIYHSVRTVLILVKVKQKCENSPKRSKNIYLALIRIILFTALNFLAYLVTTGVYFYELSINDENLKHFSDHLICNLNITTVMARKHPINKGHYNISNDYFYINDINSCQTYEPPNILLVYIQLSAIFCVKILTSSWIWTRATISTWKRFFNHHFNGNDSKTLHLKPYELIADSSQKREQIQQGVYIHNFTTKLNDPVDMDLNSAQSQSVSTNFQQNFPALLERRYTVCGNDVLIGNAKQTNFSNDQTNNNFVGSSSFASQNLSVSDVSQQQVSLESMEQMEMTFRNQRRKKKKEREKRIWSRRGSDTSGSLISSANITVKASNKLRNTNNNNNKNNEVNKNTFVTKSTSTGDLLNMILGSTLGMPTMIQTPVINAGYNPYVSMMQIPSHQQPLFAGQATMMAPTPITQHKIPTPNYPNTSAINKLNCQQQQQQQDQALTQSGSGGVRMNRTQCVSTFAFTHGMSDQTGHSIINPMVEKRRPDSSSSNAVNNQNVNKSQSTITANNDCSNLVIVNQAISPFGATNPLANNYMLNALSTNNIMAPVYSVVNGNTAAAAAGQFVSPASNYIYPTTRQTAAAAMAAAYPTPNLITPGTAAFSAVAAAAAAANIPRYYNTQAAFLVYQQSKNLSEIENYMREHEKFKSLFTAHLSDSESNSEFLPICLTESETSRNGYYSDDHQKLQSTKLMVQERMKRVEDQVEQKDCEQEQDKQRLNTQENE